MACRMSMLTLPEYTPNKTQQQLESPTTVRPATSDRSVNNGGTTTEAGSASEHNDNTAHLMINSIFVLLNCNWYKNEMTFLP